jgi:hypothetical protein
MAFYAFQKRLASFVKYLRLTQNLDSRFDNATAEELAAAGDCLICRYDDTIMIRSGYDGTTHDHARCYKKALLVSPWHKY